MAKKKTKKTTERKTKEILIPPIDKRLAIITVRGLTSLITRPMPAKGIPDKKKAKSGPIVHDDDETEFQNSLYKIGKNKYGFPGNGFKLSAVEACTSLGKAILTKVAAKQCFHVVNKFVEIKCKPGPKPRRDIVRVPPKSNSAVNRIRAEFWPWGASVKVLYNHQVIQLPQLVSLFNLAGFAVGIGEWRVEKNGSNGMFEVIDAKTA